MMRATLRGLIPARIAQLLRDLGRLEGGARGTYLRLAWGRRLDAERPDALRAAHAGRVVTVCHGNILRSPYAAALLRTPAIMARLPRLRVSSAGLHALPGKSADPRGVRVAREAGVDLGSHRATMLDDRIVAEADLLLVMDYVNAAEILARHPEAANKVQLLGSFEPVRAGDAAIADPYSGTTEDVRACYRRIEAAVSGLTERLMNGADPSRQSPSSR